MMREVVYTVCLAFRGLSHEKPAARQLGNKGASRLLIVLMSSFAVLQEMLTYFVFQRHGEKENPFQLKWQDINNFHDLHHF